MSLPDFEYLEPATVCEACTLLAEDPNGSVVFAGGTDVVVYLKAGPLTHKRLISLGRIPDLDQLEMTDKGGLIIGAMTTINRIARGEGAASAFPGIVDAARSVAAEQVRNMATVVGNLCMAVPSADMAPILIAWGAELRVSSQASERVVPLRDFFIGPRQTVLGPTDIVTAIEVPPRPKTAGDASIRQGGRVSLSLPIVSAAAVVEMESGICTRADIALGAVAPTPLLASRASEFLIGKSFTGDVLAEAGEIASSEAKPIDDLRASRQFRFDLIKVLTGRVLKRAALRVGE
jgi:CO/xanthine dehydrogenase FAD-binding subunit